jgi:hypothetical protein
MNCHVNANAAIASAAIAKTISTPPHPIRFLETKKF